MINREVIAGFLDGVRPEPKLTVSEWADRYRMLSSKASAEPGRYRTDRTPYAREIMDALSPASPYKFVVSMKGAQIGFSEVGFNWLGFCIHYAPGPFLLVNPTQTTMEDNSKLRIAPMIESTPVLSAKIAPPKSRGSENSLLFKTFPGGVLRMTGANAAAGLRSMPARYLMLDEIDGYPDDVEKEGDPLGLAIKRTDTFGSKAKIFMLSTPTTADSKINAEFLKTDQRHYHVPCPHCGDFEPIEWERLRWERNGEIYRAWIICEACGSEIEERHKTWMLANGQWVAHRPDLASPEKVGFHLSGLYSPQGMLSWSQAVRQYVEAYEVKNEPRLKKTFRNTVLGLPYEEEIDRPKWEMLMTRAGEYERGKLPEHSMEAAPGKPLFLTCGCDVQRDRIELEVVAWGIGKESWSVDYLQIQGDTSNSSDNCWEALADVMTRTWTVSGIDMQITRTGIDSSDQSTVVYAVVEKLAARGLRVIALKGASTNQQAVLAKGGAPSVSTTGKKMGRPVYLVGTGVLKSELYSFLNLEQNTDGSFPQGFCHFPNYGEHYFKSLTAEAVQIVQDARGYPREKWVKMYQRNEALDCRNYARAAAEMGGIIDFGVETMNALRGKLAIVKTYAEPEQAKPVKKSKPRQGSIWD